MKELTKQIKEKSFYKVYLLTGDEPYLVLQAKHMLNDTRRRYDELCRFYRR